MTSDETHEKDRILEALDAANLDGGKFSAWVHQTGYQGDGIEKGVFFYRAEYGHIAFSFRSGGIDSCSYAPFSTQPSARLVIAGRSISGKSSLPAAVIKEIEFDHSYKAIPKRVAFIAAFEVGFAPENVGPESKIVDDLLYGDDDAFERTYLLEQIFDELEIWFKFNRPNIDEKYKKFNTLGDIIAYVQKNWSS